LFHFLIICNLLAMLLVFLDRTPLANVYMGLNAAGVGVIALAALAVYLPADADVMYTGWGGLGIAAGIAAIASVVSMSALVVAVIGFLSVALILGTLFSYVNHTIVAALLDAMHVTGDTVSESVTACLLLIAGILVGVVAYKAKDAFLSVLGCIMVGLFAWVSARAFALADGFPSLYCCSATDLSYCPLYLQHIDIIGVALFVCMRMALVVMALWYGRHEAEFNLLKEFQWKQEDRENNKKKKLDPVMQPLLATVADE
jgi:hypothetical protein